MSQREITKTEERTITVVDCDLCGAQDCWQAYTVNHCAVCKRDCCSKCLRWYVVPGSGDSDEKICDRCWEFHERYEATLNSVINDYEYAMEQFMGEWKKKSLEGFPCQA